MNGLLGWRSTVDYFLNCMTKKYSTLDLEISGGQAKEQKRGIFGEFPFFLKIGELPANFGEPYSPGICM